jgi:hypothetical protein
LESNQSRAKRIKRETGYTVKLSSGKKRNIYFTDTTQENIILYNLETDERKKEKLFNEIYPILNKVAHNLIYKYKLLTEDVTFNELVKETTTHLATKLHRYDVTKGSAFSFFSIVANNYLVGRKILYEKNNFDSYEINTLDIPMSLDIEIYERLNNENEITSSEKINKFSSYLIDKVNIHFPHPKDTEIVNALLDIMINYDNINLNMNTKTLYFLVKEVVNCENKDILRVLKRLRKFYNRIIFEGNYDIKQ